MSSVGVVLADSVSMFPGLKLGPTLKPDLKLKHDPGRTSYQCTFCVEEMKGETEGVEGGRGKRRRGTKEGRGKDEGQVGEKRENVEEIREGRGTEGGMEEG